jgi:hypothetical protein
VTLRAATGRAVGSRLARRSDSLGAAARVPVKLVRMMCLGGPPHPDGLVPAGLVPDGLVADGATGQAATVNAPAAVPVRPSRPVATTATATEPETPTGGRVACQVDAVPLAGPSRSGVEVDVPPAGVDRAMTLKIPTGSVTETVTVVAFGVPATEHPDG